MTESNSSMRVCVMVEQPSVRGACEPRIFQYREFRQPFRWPPLLVSAFVHAVLLAAVSVPQLARWFEGDTVDWSRYKVEPLRVIVPERIYFRPDPQRPQEVSRPRESAKRPAVEPPSDSTPPPARAAVIRRYSPPPVVELPQAARQHIPTPVLLEPEFQVNPLPLTNAVPPMAFWAKRTPIPKPPRRAAVLPGRPQSKPAPPPVLDAPPVLAVPNREALASDVNIASAPLQPKPVLPVRPSTTVPVRLLDAAPALQSGPIDPRQGDAVNVIAMSPDVLPPGRVVAIPQGVQSVRATAGGDGTATGADGADATGHGAASGQAGRASNGGAGAGTGHGSGGGNGSSHASGGSGTDIGTAVSASAGTGPGGIAGGRMAARGGATRVEPSAAGVFDVVIVQSSSAADRKSAPTGILTGTPVYSVYLQVGGEREWLLEYCVPAHTGSQGHVYEINIDNGPAISPPYPVSTAVPAGVLSQNRPKRIFLHGYLTAAGRFRDMKPTDVQNAVAVQIASVLAEWQFRPATKNDKPIEIEVLLAVPPRS